MNLVRSKNIVYNIVFALNCLLIFLLLFENRLSVPSWLQVVGRMHPLVLHFPIVLMIVAIVAELFLSSRKDYSDVGDWLLLSVAGTAVLTSIMGLLLSVEGGYEEDALFFHKYGGIVLSLLALTWYAFREKLRQRKIATVLVGMVSVMAIIVTGHQGANITHGEDFLLGPISSDEEQPPVLMEDAVVFTHMVMPVLKSKCISCHNSGKAKGELIMESAELLVKGGKNGSLWDTTVADLGLMFERIHLPLEKKEHMPPKGKPQLTEQEIEILERWVRGGADFEVKVAELKDSDTLKLIAASIFKTVETDHYDFEAADDKLVRSLNTNYRTVYPLATGSPALGVEFFSASQFKSEQLNDLQKIKDQIVSLNLNKMPVKDEDLKLIAGFKNLRKLNLSFTDITSRSIGELAALENLKSLSVSGTKADVTSLRKLSGIESLTQLYAWNTSIREEEISSLQKSFPKTTIEKGFFGDTLVISLNPPAIDNEEQIISEPVPLKMKHVIRNVSIRYTLDGSEPDSSSTEYKNDLVIDRSVTVRAKAFKEGWMSSDVLERSFFRSTYKADSAEFLKKPNDQYKGDGALTLMNLEKGDLNFRSGKWLGYKENPMESMLYFKKPVKLSSVSVSALVDIPSYIMPPKKIEVWGGKNKGKLVLLKTLQPVQPSGDKPGYLFGYNLQFDSTEVECLKLVVVPVSKLPSWHRGKGEQGWIFIDEIFLN
ncbi:MAG: chitobiase/beta-hexosaminidase C-terminal domain-containing protein [Flavitalea sp.]